MNWYIICMDMLISIGDEPKISQLMHHFDNPYMPKQIGNPCYIQEIREPDKDILGKIRDLLPLIEKQFCESGEYLLETTSNGFKLKKRIAEGVYNQDSWDKWNNFSNSLYNEIAKAVGLERG